MTGGWSKSDAVELQAQLARRDLPAEVRLAAFIDAVRIHALLCTWDYETSAFILGRFAADGDSLIAAYQDAVNNHDGELGAAVSSLDPYDLRDLEATALREALGEFDEDVS